MILSGILIAVLYFFHNIIALVALIAWLILVVYFKRVELQYGESMEEYVLTMARRIKRSENHAMSFLPIGVIVIDGDGDIAWFNNYISETIKLDLHVGDDFQAEWAPKFNLLNKDEEILESANFKFEGRVFKVQYVKEEGLVYFIEETAILTLEKQFRDSNVVVGMLQLDNFIEMSKELSEHDSSMLLAEVMTIIFEWAHRHKILIKRLQQESYMLIFDQSILDHLEQDRFSILDEVKKLEERTDILITVSLGIAAGTSDTIVIKGQQAQESLDLALARGGDQVAIKRGDKITYFGGKTDAVEKRTKVRARVMAHSLRELIVSSDKVYIMPHTQPDPDAFGSALGALSIVQSVGKTGYVLLDKVNPSIRKIVKYLKDHGMGQYIITPEEALNGIRKKSLLICVDHNKPSLTMDKRILGQTNNIVVIDHHRRSEEVFDKPSLLYVEPYASSTCELITELIEYQYNSVRLSQIVATLLMAGIVVDTKNFVLHTGSRTFEAASFLRREGADSMTMQKLLADDFDLFVERSEIVRNAERYENGIAIAKAKASDRYGTVVIAQAANTLITLDGIRASFVLQEVDYGVAISARSQGEVNVQIIMEKLGGGGHLTTAAAQVKDVTIEEAEDQLKAVLRQLKEEGSL
ncbi:hypothetical protein BHF68_03750 [Desulfuribacillus alkaliarsenatis]|uniref:Cyclic-di-AMP phosphodiesterase n=2 Tax=Desulfuribacillus alkaliarsenatis TaxID=766136 RepID=A0A1E5G3B2_9FIRM|nr:hypothetical protein BHF68_03750 [Desulfuribacillus alkaliarsenatis]